MKTKRQIEREVQVERQVRMIKMTAAIVFIVAVMAVAVMLLKTHLALSSNYGDQYATIIREGNFTLIINGGANVRTEPLAALHHEVAGLPEGYMNEHYSVCSESVNNCIGTVKDKNGTGAVFHVTHYVEVTESWFDDCICGDDWNGPFIGLIVDELTREELKLLPRNAKKDPDGIVWISSKYLKIVNN